jgi:protein-S-isoprenylcysteine O-methyltransferase Ste14
MLLLKLAIFAVVSVGAVCLSWPSLRDPRSHGFPRFFAFETLLGLILLNVDRWTHDPLSVPQIVSWCLLACSLGLAIHGFYLLRVIGKPQGDFESTTALVTLGAYKYIRHPLYSSLLLLGWGAFLKDLSLFSVGLIAAATACLIATARLEEAENLRKFGDEYTAYMKATKMFIPFLL